MRPRAVWLASSLLVSACSATVSDDAAPGVSSSERTAFFGDLHVHTRNAYDAFVFGTRADPDAAYEFAKGNAITHPARSESKPSK